jgi:hypothetical protein
MTSISSLTRGVFSLTALVVGGSSVAHAAVPHVVARAGQVVDGTVLSNNLTQFPDINEASQYTYADFAITGGGVYTNAGKLFGAGQSMGGRTFSRLFGVHPDMNDSGAVGFVFVDTTSTAHVATQSGIQFAAFSGTLNGQPISSAGPVVLNNAGVAGLNVISGTGQAAALIGASGVLVGQTGFTQHGITLTNTFLVQQNNFNGSGEGVFVGVDGSTRRVLSQNRLIYTQGQSVGGFVMGTLNSGAAINEAGSVAFQGVLNDGRPAILSMERGLITARGTVISGMTIQNLGFQISMDELGRIGWRGTFVGGGEGIFIDQTLLLKSGDVVDDVTIATLGNPSINSAGNWIVHATFTNGSNGIVALVPEPTTALTAAASLLTLRRRRSPC